MPVTANDLLTEYSKDTKIATVSQTIASMAIDVTDAKFRHRKDEENVYLVSKHMRMMLRRGNTLIRILDKDSWKVKNTIVGRRGLPKFFDYRKEHFEQLLSGD